MRRRIAAVVGACGIAVGTSLSNPPPTPEALVAQLGSDFFPDREAAAKALDSLGSQAVPALRAALRSDDPEVRRRAAILLEKHAAAAESAARLAPKRVRVVCRNAYLADAVADLKNRTGINLVLDSSVADPVRRVTCDIDELPAWEAVEAFCKAVGLREVVQPEVALPKVDIRGRMHHMPPPIPPTPEQVPVLLADGTAAPQPGSRSTAVRVVALPANFPGNVATLGTGDFVIHLDVAPVRGLNWQDVTGIKLTRVIDDAGRHGSSGPYRLPPPDADDVLLNFALLGGGQALRWDSGEIIPPPATIPNPRAVPLTIRVPTPEARSLRLLEGAILGAVKVPDQELVVALNPAKLVGTPLTGPGGVRLTVQEYRADAAEVRVRVAVEYPNAWAQRKRTNFAGLLDPVRPSDDGFQVKAVTAAGLPVAAGGGGDIDLTDDGTTTVLISTLTFPASTPPAKLVLVGSKVVPVEVPFRMENVPLP